MTRAQVTSSARSRSLVGAFVVGALACMSLLAACDARPAASSPTDAARAAPSADAFCGAHGVAEAVCTICNPALAVIFKAKGDWCSEHGLPESFCPRCHPERGGRPAVALDADAPPDGTKVVLARPEIAELAGLRTAEARTVEEADEIVVVGTIVHDASARAEVTARAHGVVRALFFELGSRVRKDAPLVRIESGEVRTQRAQLVAATSEIEAARAARERAGILVEKGIAARSEVLDAQRRLDAALAEQAAAQTALDLIGADDDDANFYVLKAPLAGTCIERETAIGRLVAPGDTLCVLVDTSFVWAELDVPEPLLSRLASGSAVVITSASAGERRFEGTIDHVGLEIDRHTRTGKARVRLENQDGALRANAFVRARIVTSARQSRVLVPRDALQSTRGTDVVFVELERGSYELRRVARIDRARIDEDGAEAALASGVRAGERVVVEGSFLLKTETLKGEIGAGCCAVD